MESTGRADCVQMSAATYDAINLPELALPLQRLDVKGKGVMSVHTVCAFTADTERVLDLLAAAAFDEAAASPTSPPPAGQRSPLCLSPTSPSMFRRSLPWRSSVDEAAAVAPGWAVGRSRRASTQSDGSAAWLAGTFRRSYSEPVSMSDIGTRQRRASRAWAPAAQEAVSWARASDQHAPRLATPVLGARGAAACLCFGVLVAITTSHAELRQNAPLLLRLAALLAATHAAFALPYLLRPQAPRAQPRESAAVVMASLHLALARAGTEADILRAGCDAAMALLPGAIACALGVFAEGADGSVVSRLECGGEPAAQRALAAALPAGVSSKEDSGRSSVARACAADADAAPIDSSCLAGGLNECTDWAAACAAGLPSTRAVTLKLSAGLVQVGFVQLHFGAALADGAVDTAALLALSEAISGAIFVRRAFAINRDAADTMALPVIDELSSEGRLQATPELSDEEAGATAMLDNEAMLDALDASIAADAKLLLTWDLDAWALPDAEVARLMVAMLHSLGLVRRFALRPAALFKFVECVAAGYKDNPFHCWRHAFMVQHACWLFLADPAVRALLDELACLALLLSAICHDLEHPGLTNAYQVNSCSELALRYNDTSVLEHHHTAVAFTMIERSGIVSHLNDGEYKALRKLIVSAILATDMGVHKDLLARVVLRATRDAVHGAGSGGFARASPDDRSLLVCFLLHCADLSNPVLPPELSRRIAAELGREFKNQAEMESRAQLPITVMLAVDDVGTAKLELGFIGTRRGAALLHAALATYI